MKRKKIISKEPPRLQPEDLLAAKEQVYERAMRIRAERDAHLIVGRIDVMGVFSMAHHALMNGLVGNTSIEDTLEQLAAAATYTLASLNVARDHAEQQDRHLKLEGDDESDQ